MADETLNIGSDEVNAAEPEVTEPPAGDSPPEVAVPELELAEPAGPGMEEPSAGEPPGEEHEPDAPGDTPPREVDTPEAEQPEVAGAEVEDTLAQASLFGDGPAVESPAAEELKAPAPGNDGEVVVSFNKISELISERNQKARAAVEQEEAATPQPEGMDKGPEEPAQEEPAPKRQGRPPKEKKPVHEGKADKPRRGRKPKEAAQEKDTPAGKPRDKVSQGKWDKTAPEQDAPGGGSAAGAPAVEGDTPTADVEAAFGLKDATRATKEEVVYLDLSELHAFKDHPFKVREDAEMQSLVESVKTGGVNQPALVRPREGGGYEIIAGHRRQKASELAGFRNVTRDLLYDKHTNKQFITVQTSGGSTFYIVIDYDKPVDEEGEQYETYFLGVADEADLLAAFESAGGELPACTCTEKCAAGAVNTDCPVCATNMTECAGVEPEPEPAEDPEPEAKAGFPAGTLLLALAVVVIGGGAGWYFKIYRPKQERATAQAEEDYSDESDPYDDPEEDYDPYGEDEYDEEETEGKS